MNCETASELAAAYALGALSGEEARAFEEHIASCDRHNEELAGYRRAAAGLARTVDPVAPPAGLRSRILEAIEERPAAGSMPARALPPRQRAWLPWALAAAFGVIAIGMAVWNLMLLDAGDGEPGEQGRIEFAGTGGSGYVARLPESGLVVVRLDGLANLPADQDYQVWAIAGGEPQSLGLLTVASGSATLAAETPLTFDAIAVTIEPAGGSPGPTTEPILVAQS